MRKEDLKQLQSYLPGASCCFLASLFPLRDIFGQEEGVRQVSLCQTLNHFLEQSTRLEESTAAAGGKKSASRFKNQNDTAILEAQLLVPGPYTYKSYREKIEKNFEMESAGYNPNSPQAQRQTSKQRQNANLADG